MTVAFPWLAVGALGLIVVLFVFLSLAAARWFQALRPGHGKPPLLHGLSTGAHDPPAAPKEPQRKLLGLIPGGTRGTSAAKLPPELPVMSALIEGGVGSGSNGNDLAVPENAPPTVRDLYVTIPADSPALAEADMELKGSKIGEN